MAEKLARLGVERDPTYMYFVRRGDVWRIPRPRPDLQGADRLPERVAEVGIHADSAYLYFLDADGDVSRVKRLPVTPKRKRKSSGNGRGKNS